MFGPPQPRLVSKSTYRSYTANPSADRFARSHPFSRAPPVFSSQVQPGATADANPHTLQRSPGGIDERDLPSVSVGAKYPPSMTMNSPSINSSVSYPVRNSPAAKLRTPPFGRGASADTNQSQSRMQRLRHAAPLSPAAAADETSRAVSSAMGELQAEVQQLQAAAEMVNEHDADLESSFQQLQQENRELRAAKGISAQATIQREAAVRHQRTAVEHARQGQSPHRLQKPPPNRHARQPSLTQQPRTAARQPQQQQQRGASPQRSPKQQQQQQQRQRQQQQQQQQRSRLGNGFQSPQRSPARQQHQQQQHGQHHHHQEEIHQQRNIAQAFPSQGQGLSQLGGVTHVVPVLAADAAAAAEDFGAGAEGGEGGGVFPATAGYSASLEEKLQQLQAQNGRLQAENRELRIGGGGGSSCSDSTTQLDHAAAALINARGVLEESLTMMQPPLDASAQLDHTGLMQVETISKEERWQSSERELQAIPEGERGRYVIGLAAKCEVLSGRLTAAAAARIERLAGNRLELQSSMLRSDRALEEACGRVEAAEARKQSMGDDLESLNALYSKRQVMYQAREEGLETQRNVLAAEVERLRAAEQWRLQALMEDGGTGPAMAWAQQQQHSQQQEYANRRFG